MYTVCRGADQSLSAPLQVPGSTSTGRVICSSDLAECVSVPGDFLRPQWGLPPRLLPPFEAGVHRPAPLKGEYRWGRRNFWEYRARVGSSPAPGPT